MQEREACRRSLSHHVIYGNWFEISWLYFVWQYWSFHFRVISINFLVFFLVSSKVFADLSMDEGFLFRPNYSTKIVDTIIASLCICSLPLKSFGHCQPKCLDISHFGSFLKRLWVVHANRVNWKSLVLLLGGHY